jgi:hypothetical protein
MNKDNFRINSLVSVLCNQPNIVMSHSEDKRIFYTDKNTYLVLTPEEEKNIYMNLVSYGYSRQYYTTWQYINKTKSHYVYQLTDGRRQWNLSK